MRPDRLAEGRTALALASQADDDAGTFGPLWDEPIDWTKTGPAAVLLLNVVVERCAECQGVTTEDVRRQLIRDLHSGEAD